MSGYMLLKNVLINTSAEVQGVMLPTRSAVYVCQNKKYINRPFGLNGMVSEVRFLSVCCGIQQTDVNHVQIPSGKKRTKGRSILAGWVAGSWQTTMTHYDVTMT
jgi:hypothetical protein